MTFIWPILQRWRAIQSANSKHKNLGEPSLFGYHADIFNLAFGILMLVTTLGVCLYSPSFASSSHGITHFCANILCFNATHLLFNLMMILGLPELREWSQQVRSKENIRLWRRGTLVFAAISLIMIFGPKVTGFYTTRWGYIAFMLLQFTIGFHHVIAQMRGLSFSYNATYLASLNDPRELKDGIELSQKIEKIGSHLLVISFSSFYIAKAFQIDGFPSGLEQLCAAASILIIILSSLFLPQRLRNRKLLYYPRLLLGILAPTIQIAFPAYGAIHGVESVLVFRKMTASSRAPKKTKQLIYFAALVSSLILIFICYPRQSFFHFSNVADSSLALKAAFIVFMGCKMFHYYLDAVLFGMKSSASRRLVSPLFLPNTRHNDATDHPTGGQLISIAPSSADNMQTVATKQSRRNGGS